MTHFYLSGERKLIEWNTLPHIADAIDFSP